MQLTEAFENRKFKLGEVPFSKTKIDDAHIKKAVHLLAQALGKNEGEILAQIHHKINEFAPIAAKAPILYDTIQNNIVESTVFHLMEEHKPPVEGASKFSFPVFKKLEGWIKAEHDQFFPLRNFIDHKHKYEPKIVMIPSTDEKENKKYASVKTAAATADATFIFYKPFMQSLIDFAHLKGIKPKGKKWKSNGGNIPDDYAYIEFLIVHEFMHFTYADFHYQKILKASGKIINWVGDFRTNYNLVKSGMEQLPMGLFNDHVNLDRQNSYKEMYELVKKEFEKLKPDEQEKVEDALDADADDHDVAGDDQPEPGEGDPSDEKKKGNADGEPGEDGDGDGEPEHTEADIEEHNKKINDKQGEGKKDVDKPEDTANKKISQGHGNPGEGGRSTDTHNPEGTKFDYSKVRPSLGWEALLRKMITSTATDSYETYQKPNRRSITSIDIAKQAGAASVKPGEILKDSDLKIGFVVDSSGSMSDVVAKIYANIDNLLKRGSKDMSPTFWLFKFSNTHVKYLCNAKSGTYGKVDKIGEKTMMEKGSLKSLFTDHFGAGTNFNEPLSSDIKELMKKKFNICMFLDGDIFHGSNFEVFLELYKHATTQLFVVFDRHETFIQCCKLMKQIPKNFTYFKD